MQQTSTTGSLLYEVLHVVEPVRYSETQIRSHLLPSIIQTGYPKPVVYPRPFKNFPSRRSSPAYNGQFTLRSFTRSWVCPLLI